LEKSNTRERIMEAALSLFSIKGYDGSATRDIAQMAEVNEITLFRHFGSKENLFREVLSHYAPTSMLSEKLNAQLQGNLREDLTLLAHTYLEAEYKNLDYVRIGIMEIPRNPSLADLIYTIPRRLEEHLAEYLTDLAQQQKIDERNFKLMSRMFYGQLFHHVLMICSFKDNAALLQAQSDEMVDTLVSMFVHTLRYTENEE
jgi:AcrR family transcriptional regulator